VWEASGHVENFVDRLVDCKNCKRRFRVDHLPEENLRQNKCPVCGGELTEPRKFNLMMETYIGVVEGERMKTYLRGEACQNIYLDYDNVLKSSRMAIPFLTIRGTQVFKSRADGVFPRLTRAAPIHTLSFG